MGPRQIIGEASSTSRPMDITFKPQPSSGFSLRSAVTSGSRSRPVIRGTEGP